MSARGVVGKHLDPVVLAAYLDETLREDDLDRADRHLAGCAGCRDAVAALRSLPAPQVLPEEMMARAMASPRSRSWALPATAAAAAVTLTLFGAWVGLRREAPPMEHRYRAAPEEDFRALSPEPGERVSGAEVVFRWSPSPVADRYVVTIVDEDGASVGTIIVQPPQTTASWRRPASPAVLFWKVAAQRGGRTIAETRPTALLGP